MGIFYNFDFFAINVFIFVLFCPLLKIFQFDKMENLKCQIWKIFHFWKIWKNRKNLLCIFIKNELK
jgi:hypothetical protein